MKCVAALLMVLLLDTCFGATESRGKQGARPESNADSLAQTVQKRAMDVPGLSNTACSPDYAGQMLSLLPESDVDAKILRYMPHADNRRVLSRFRHRQPLRFVPNAVPVSARVDKWNWRPAKE